MDFKIVYLPKMLIVGKELRTTWVNNECYAAIPAFWQQQRNNNLLHNIPHKMHSDVIVGLYTHYTADFSLTSGHYSLIIGTLVVSAEDVPEEMVIKAIPAAKYAVFTARGHFASAIAKTWIEEIWSNKDIVRTFANDFEWYDSKSTNDEKSIVNIYISIK